LNSPQEKIEKKNSANLFGPQVVGDVMGWVDPILSSGSRRRHGLGANTDFVLGEIIFSGRRRRHGLGANTDFVLGEIIFSGRRRRHGPGGSDFVLGGGQGVGTDSRSRRPVKAVSFAPKWARKIFAEIFFSKKCRENFPFIVIKGIIILEESV
jgi:hypothetical protein